MDTLIYLALLCKESALMLLPAIVLADVILLKTPWRQLPSRHWHLVVAGLLWITITRMWITRSLDGIVRSTTLQLQTQSKAVIYYIYTIVFPAHLNIEHQFFVGSDLIQSALGGAALLSAAVIFWNTATSSGRFLLCTAALWSLPTTLMPLNVLFNERRSYMLVALTCVGIGLLFKEKSA